MLNIQIENITYFFFKMFNRFIGGTTDLNIGIHMSYKQKYGSQNQMENMQILEEVGLQFIKIC